MVRAEGYEEGLNSFLDRKINPSDLLEDAKEILYYIPRIVPGVGLISLGIREHKERKGKPFPYYTLKRKEDKIAMGKYAIQVGWLAFAILKAGVTYKGAQSIINSINQTKDKNITPSEIKKEINKENELERTVTWGEILKVNG